MQTFTNIMRCFKCLPRSFPVFLCSTCCNKTEKKSTNKTNISSKKYNINSKLNQIREINLQLTRLSRDQSEAWWRLEFPDANVACKLQIILFPVFDSIWILYSLLFSCKNLISILEIVVLFYCVGSFVLFHDTIDTAFAFSAKDCEFDSCLVPMLLWKLIINPRPPEPSSPRGVVATPICIFYNKPIIESYNLMFATTA